jgi:hypothetical protein
MIPQRSEHWHKVAAQSLTGFRDVRTNTFFALSEGRQSPFCEWILWLLRVSCLTITVLAGSQHHTISSAPFELPCSITDTSDLPDATAALMVVYQAHFSQLSMTPFQVNPRL